MSSKDIQRGVRPARERNAGDAPVMGRVPRMAQPGTPGMHPGVGQGRSSRGKAGEGNRRRTGTVPWGWMALLVVLALGLLGGAFAWWLYPMLDRRGTMAATAPAHSPAGGLMDLPEFNAPPEEEVKQIVRRAMAVRDAGEVEKFYNTGTATAEEVVAFLAGMEEKDGRISRYDPMRGMDANGLPLEGVLVSFGEGSRAKNRIALLTPDAKGDWKVDFPAFERRADPPWAELLERRAESSVVRVYVAKDYYYNGPFSDEGEWRCYGIAASDVEDLMMGYCRRGSAQDAAMSWILQERPRLARATLELGVVEGSERRQFEIKRVLAQDWVVGDVAFDER